MSYEVVLMAIAVVALEYTVWKYKKHAEYLERLIAIHRKDHNNMVCKVSRLLRCSRVALDGRLIVPRKVYDTFIEQVFDNEGEAVD